MVPFPAGEVASVPGWDVQVRELVRGDEAWQMVQAANMFNDPPLPGFEYVVLRLSAKSTAEDDELHEIGESDFFVTGSGLVKRTGGSVVDPEPQFDGEMFAGGEIEGWATYSVGEGEDQLILVYDPLFAFDEDVLRFIAINEGASIGVSPELADIEPTDVGTSRGNAVPFGETATSEDWQLEVLEVVRGEEAWNRILDANQFNDPPPQGAEYVLTKVRVRYIGTADETVNISGSAFQSTGSANVMYDTPSVVDPEPALDAYLYPGGEYEGWVTVLAAEGEEGMILVFEPLFDWSDENVRYLSLEP
jgi:hypothetical protein